MKQVTAFQIIDHGIDHEQYFSGCGTFGTEFTDVATGAGSNVQEAAGDALEQLAMNDWDIDTIEADITMLPRVDDIPEDSEGSYHYVSIRVAGGAA